MVQSHASEKPIPNRKTGTPPLLHCDYYHKDSHTKDRYFKFVGYPKRQIKAHAYNTESNAVLSTNKLTTTTTPQLHPTNIANFANAIGSGATNHIIYSPSFLSSIEPLSPTNLVKLVNGNFAPFFIVAQLLFQSTTLYIVLCVPSFSFNVLSVQKLTFDLQCSITFFLDRCIF
ncbi:hypothetical protein AMTRI_Chr06g199140 [Amborella trichopoda]